MDEFILLMRLDIITKEAQPSPEKLEVYMKQYHDWVGGIAAQNRRSKHRVPRSAPRWDWQPRVHRPPERPLESVAAAAASPHDRRVPGKFARDRSHNV